MARYEGTGVIVSHAVRPISKPIFLELIFPENYIARIRV